MDETNTAISSPWKVFLSKKAEKQLTKLPEDMYLAVAALRLELKLEGPIQAEWQNYGKLKGKRGEYHHCHLNKGRPRYVAVWEVTDNNIKLIEIVFVGPHGSVNYSLFREERKNADRNVHPSKQHKTC